MRLLLVCLTAAALGSCAWMGRAKDPVPTLLVPGTKPGDTLVVVLPGFADTVEDLRDKGVATAIQRAWPATDVLLVGANLPYYRTGKLVPQLEKNVIGPVQGRYKEIWLAGGSMGGLGVLLYEWHHRGELTGLVLMSPFLGSGDVIKEVREAGLAQWDPGPLPQKMDGTNFTRLIWSMIKDWRTQPKQARRVWLVCGTEDRLFEDVQLLAPVVAPEHYLPSPGGHDWDFWIPAIEATFRKIVAERPKR